MTGIRGIVVVVRIRVLTVIYKLLHREERKRCTEEGKQSCTYRKIPDILGGD